MEFDTVNQATDLSLKALAQIIGVGDTPTLFSSLMGWWNMTAMSIGGVIVLYILCRGTLATAHEGEVLGKWSAVWLPIRVALAMAVVIPLDGGYSLAQRGIVQLVKFSVSTTNEVWAAAAQKLESGEVTAATLPPPQSTRQVFGQIVKQVACITTTSRDDQEFGTTQTKMEMSNTIQLTKLETGGAAESHVIQLRAGLCGGWTWPATATGGSTIPQIQAQAIQNLISGLTPMAAGIVTGHPLDAATMAGAFRIFEQQWSAASSSARDLAKLEGSGKEVWRDGWASAASYWQRLGHITQLALDEASITPTMLDIRFDAAGDLAYGESLRIGQSWADRSLSEMDKTLTPARALSEEKGDGLDWLFHPFTTLQKYLIDSMHSQPDPLIRMQATGHVALDIWNTLTIAKAASAVIPGPVAKIAGGVLPDQSGLFMTALLVLGGALAYVIPMVPFYLFYMGVIHWLTSIVVALTAAPVWSLGHMAPGGHQVFGAAEKGYIRLLDLGIRPILMLVGLLTGTGLAWAGDMVLAGGFTAAFEGAEIGSTTGLVGLICGLGIYVGLSAMLVFFSFRLILTLPNGVIDWVGQSAGTEGGGNTFVGAAMQVVTQKMGGAATGGGGGGALAGLKNALKPATASKAAAKNSDLI